VRLPRHDSKKAEALPVTGHPPLPFESPDPCGCVSSENTDVADALVEKKAHDFSVRALHLWQVELSAQPSARNAPSAPPSPSHVRCRVRGAAPAHGEMIDPAAERRRSRAITAAITASIAPPPPENELSAARSAFRSVTRARLVTTL